MTVRPYPFPGRNRDYPNTWDVVFLPGRSDSSPEYKVMLERSESDEAKMWRLRYLGIEEELERAFRYVNPSDDNVDAFSIKFAEIIRAGSNAYEILAKELYRKFYVVADRIDIFNYLALDIFLQLSRCQVIHLAAMGSFPNHP